MLEIHTLTTTRIIFALLMLAIACWFDLKKREVHDVIWAIFAGIAAVLIILSDNPFEQLYPVGVSLIVTPVAILIWRIGFFGGADAFALITLGALAPGITLTQNTVTPFTVLTNAVILSITPMFVNLARNSVLLARGKNIFDGFNETLARKIFAMFIGYRASKPKFGFSIEETVGGHKKLKLSPHHAENTEFCNTEDTWITPGIPYLIFIATGFVFQLIYGDIMFSFLNIFI